MRLFIGIALSPAVIAELTTLTARLQSKADSMRWTGPESWHITLQFVGNTSAAAQLEAFYEAYRKSLKHLYE